MESFSHRGSKSLGKLVEMRGSHLLNQCQVHNLLAISDIIPSLSCETDPDVVSSTSHS